MKQLLTIVLLCLACGASAQTHPLAFGPTSFSALPNWYADYVGFRFEVTSPASFAGDKAYTISNNGSGGSTEWGGTITTPIVNGQVIMPQAGDSLAGSPITTSMTGKIALVYRGGGVQYGDKALAAEAAGAIACVVVNNISGPPLGMGGRIQREQRYHTGTDDITGRWKSNRLAV